MQGVVDNLTPRWPNVPAATGHYESTYLVASHPVEPVAIWIRYTVHKRPHQPPLGSIWFTLFDHGHPTAMKVTSDELSPTTGFGAELLSVGTAGTIRRDHAAGSLRTGDASAAWNLAFEPCDDDLQHLPYAWMYRAPIPRTKSTSPYPSMMMTGSVTVSGREIPIKGWRGTLGHNWGSEHAHRWIWLRGADFTESPEGWLDVVIGRIKIGPAITPWLANGAFAPQGSSGPRYRIGGLLRRTTIAERTDGCDLILPGDHITLAVKVTAPLSSSVGWEYADPSGAKHQVRNCSQAGLAVTADAHEGATDTFHTSHGGVYELGSATFNPDIRMQPDVDGEVTAESI